jgi:hypothetical protein
MTRAGGQLAPAQGLLGDANPEFLPDPPSHGAGGGDWSLGRLVAVATKLAFRISDVRVVQDLAVKSGWG